MRHSARLAVLVLFAAVTPMRAQSPFSGLPADTSSHVVADSGLAAPSASTAPTLAVERSNVAGAPVTGLRAGAYTRESARPMQPNMAVTHANLGQSRAMMVVGVAALIAGAIIGGTPGTLIMVGGTVVGLVGLYDYLQ